MIFSQSKASLAIQKGVCLLFASVFIVSSVIKLLWPDSTSVIVDEQRVGPQDKLSYYYTWGLALLIGLVMLALFRWLHRRVRSVAASELGLQILTAPVRNVAWSEVYSVKKTLPNLLSGFYLINLADGTEIYTPVEPEPPTFSTLGT